MANIQIKLISQTTEKMHGQNLCSFKHVLFDVCACKPMLASILG